MIILKHFFVEEIPKMVEGNLNPKLFNNKFCNHESLNHKVEEFIVETLWLKCQISRRLKNISTPKFLTTEFSNPEISTLWFKNSWLKSLGLKCGWKFYKHTLFFILGEPRYAKIPHWMENSGNTNRIVGGQKALRPIPWQAGF